MRITSNLNAFKKRCIGFAMAASAFLFSGCGQLAYDIPYTVNPENSSYRIVDVGEENSTATSFAVDLCVAASDISVESVDMTKASGAALFDLNNKETLYAKNVHEKLYPASLTKVMTALVALKKGSPDMLLTATSNVKIQEADAQVCGLKEGDQMTLAQALHVMLINSANDAAVMIAEGVAGSVETFAEMMNEEALALGATNTHFVNPHGLSDDNHYTTVYDMYLIMNEAIKFELFNQIIQMPTYTTVYKDKNDNSKELNVNNSNHYLNGRAEAPSGITVLGGKTGTTMAAKSCLVLLSKDSSNNPYISVILRAEKRDDLYALMTELLAQINN